jgi:hypothetical protein
VIVLQLFRREFLSDELVHASGVSVSVSLVVCTKLQPNHDSMRKNKRDTNGIVLL